MKVPVKLNENYRDVKRALSAHKLNTVCQSAKCPNIGHCFASGTATFMILGEYCTRNCRFCNISPHAPSPVDPDEPSRVADAVKQLGLDYAVITSVTRDDLSDGGAGHFAETIKQLRIKTPCTRIEVLTPDFLGEKDALKIVTDAKPDVLNHNVETVPRLYPAARPEAEYGRSLEFLKTAKKLDSSIITKSGLIAGLGEEPDEIVCVLKDLRKNGVEIVTIGQYLQPSDKHHPVVRYYHPDEFESLRITGLELGFSHVESGPLVRSSYHAKDQAVTKEE